MEDMNKDKALRRMMKMDSETLRPSHDFTYHTMQRVMQATYERDRKASRNSTIFAVVLGVVLLTGLPVALYFIFGINIYAPIMQAFSDTSSLHIQPLPVMPTAVLIMGVVVILLIIFDYLMRYFYEKHHQH